MTNSEFEEQSINIRLSVQRRFFILDLCWLTNVYGFNVENIRLTFFEWVFKRF